MEPHHAVQNEQLFSDIIHYNFDDYMIMQASTGKKVQFKIRIFDRNQGFLESSVNSKSKRRCIFDAGKSLSMDRRQFAQGLKLNGLGRQLKGKNLIFSLKNSDEFSAVGKFSQNPIVSLKQ